MPTRLSCLPFDIVDAIAANLDVRSFVSLSRVSRRLYEHLQNDSTARKCGQANIQFSANFLHLGNNQQTPRYRKCLLQTFQQWEALRTANPYSVSTIAHGSSFYYNQGILCYTTCGVLRILDVNDYSGTERVISYQAFLRQLLPSDTDPAPDSHHTTLNILNYSDGIVAVLCETDAVPDPWLFAVDIRDSPNRPCVAGSLQPRNRFLLQVRLSSTAKLFVRHNDCYLYYGTHSVLGAHRHHEWLIQGFDLLTSPPTPVSLKPLHLRKFFGTDIGHTAAFAIHNSQFHAVSNQSSYESEEIDWTSSYNCIQFAVFDPDPDVRPRSIWRRQHREGPINDAWTDLGLQTDVQTNDLLIVEGRKEWLNGGSESIRTHYTSKFDLTDCEFSEAEGAGRPTHPPNDPLARTIDEKNNSHWRPGLDRIAKHTHTDGREFEFIRSKTKYNAYHAASNCFVDLVTDSIQVPGSTRPKDRLLLRVASRLPITPLEPDLDERPWPCKEGSRTTWPMVLRPRKVGDSGDDGDSDHDDSDDIKVVLGSEERFTESEAKIWPLEDAPLELTRILCPIGRLGQVDAMSDDRGIVYMAGVPDSRTGERRITFVSFDPAWGFAGIHSIYKCRASTIHEDTRGTEKDKSKELDIPIRLKREMSDRSSSPSDTKRLKTEGSKSTSSAPTATAGRNKSASPSRQQGRLLWKEEAMHISIKQGFWLR